MMRFLLAMLPVFQFGEGAVFTAWGQADCPSGTTEVYDGFAAGAQYTTQGSGANFICLTGSPSYYLGSSLYQPGTQGKSRIAPMEVHPNGNIMGSTTWNTNPSCSVCQTTREDFVMIPGAKNCPSGWTEEYEGFLMASDNTRYRSEYICMVKNPDAIIGSAGHTEEAADVWNVEAYCTGNIMCPPYNAYKEIACVVCTK